MLSLGQQDRHLAECDPEHETGRREDCGPAEHPAEGLREHAVGDRGGRSAVVAAVGGVGVEQPLEHPEQVFDVDPGDPLPAVSQRSADAEPERKQHLLERASATALDDPDPHRGGADPGVDRRLAGRFPVGAEPSEEVVGRGVAHGVAPVRVGAVVADGRGGKEDARPGLGHGRRELARRVDPARSQARLLPSGPPPTQQGLAGEVDDRLALADRSA